MLLKRGILPMVAILLIESYSCGSDPNNPNGYGLTIRNGKKSSVTGSVTAAADCTIVFSNHIQPQFGTFLKPSQNALQTIAYNGVLSQSWASVSYMQQPSAGELTVTGCPNREMNVSVVHNQKTQYDQNNYILSYIDLYKSDGTIIHVPSSPGITSPKKATIGSDGKLLIKIGGSYRLMPTLGILNKIGTYTGTYTIDVTYV